MSFSSQGTGMQKSRDTWSNRQFWPLSTKWSINRDLSRQHTGHSKHTPPTTQEMTLHVDIIRWSILKSDWLYFFSRRWRSSIQSAKTRTGADCGSDYELLIAKFRLKLKKAGKTTIPFRYDKINSLMEVTNRFKAVGLIECLKNYGRWFVTLYRRRWLKPSPRIKKCKKAKWLLRRPNK